MKFISLVIAFITLSVNSTAQSQFGIFAGVQSNNVRYLVANTEQKTKMKVGFHAGANMKIPFENKLFFAPALTYSLKGYDVTFSQFTNPPDVNAKDNSTTIHTIEISPLLQFDFNNNPGHAFIRVGPSIDVQLFGKEKYNLQNGTTVSRSMNIDLAGDYGKFGASLIGQFGYETASGFSIFAHYTHGVGSINNKDGGPRIYHRLFGISIGKYLKKNKIVIDTRNKQ
jgi:Outer membrane protein beta-barrel domain